MKFAWDAQKNQRNQKKHRVSFELAARVFADPYRIEFYDADHSDDENRWLTIGMVQQEHFGAVLVVVYTERHGTQHDEKITRLISARPANEYEKRCYYNF